MIKVMAITIETCTQIVVVVDKPVCKDTPTAKASIDVITNSRIH